MKPISNFDFIKWEFIGAEGSLSLGFGFGDFSKEEGNIQREREDHPSINLQYQYKQICFAFLTPEKHHTHTQQLRRFFSFLTFTIAEQLHRVHRETLERHWDIYIYIYIETFLRCRLCTLLHFLGDRNFDRGYSIRRVFLQPWKALAFRESSALLSERIVVVVAAAAAFPRVSVFVAAIFKGGLRFPSVGGFSVPSCGNRLRLARGEGRGVVPAGVLILEASRDHPLCQMKLCFSLHGGCCILPSVCLLLLFSNHGIVDCTISVV